jgi:DNA-binding NarL/FixJ family response regulator
MSQPIVKTLVVDNEAGMRRRVREMLGREPAVSVVGEAVDGEDALSKARELKPDLVIMDVGMPKLNGLEATRRLKAEMPHVKVIMLTVYDLPEYVDAAKGCGASAYVIKTGLYQQLLPTIASTMGATLTENMNAGNGRAKPGNGSSSGWTDTEGKPARRSFEDLVIDKKVQIVRSVARAGAKRAKRDTAASKLDARPASKDPGQGTGP